MGIMEIRKIIHLQMRYPYRNLTKTRISRFLLGKFITKVTGFEPESSICQTACSAVSRATPSPQEFMRPLASHVPDTRDSND
jgi:hypothetical protein